MRRRLGEQDSESGGANDSHPRKRSSRIIGRRTFLTGVGLVAVTPAHSLGLANAGGSRRTFVLVHGAWHGGWCWRGVAVRLRQAGHRVFTPTLTGLGERAHLLDGSTCLDTHIQDVVGVIEAEELTEICLVGHSYGGMVITGVAAECPERIASIVYLDAAVPEAGDSISTQGPGRPPEVLEAERSRLFAMSTNGIALPPPTPEVFGVTEADAVMWMQRRLTPQPVRTWFDQISLPSEFEIPQPRLYVHCTSPALGVRSFGWHHRRFADDPSWSAMTLPTGHSAMVTDPGALTGLLLEWVR